jgi:hypothetical protein
MPRYLMMSVFIITAERGLNELPMNQFTANDEATPSHGFQLFKWQ